jgi:hypothetical protein
MKFEDFITQTQFPGNKKLVIVARLLITLFAFKPLVYLYIYQTVSF